MRRFTILAVAGLASLAGCSLLPGDDSGIHQYVALGDSYTAGPGIEPVDPDAGACWRSKHNYPAMVANLLDIELTDASCAGATTASVLRNINTSAGTSSAQVGAVTKDTDLVTIGIGANDDEYAGKLFSQCAGTATSRVSCQGFIDGLDATLSTTSRNVTKVVREVQRRAPGARVILVGYVGFAPADGRCDTPGTDRRVVKLLAQAEQKFEAMLAEAAEAAKVEFIAMNRRSKGHDACSDKPWVNVEGGKDGIALHPNRAAMEAVATAIVAEVGKNAS